MFEQTTRNVIYAVSSEPIMQISGNLISSVWYLIKETV